MNPDLTFSEALVHMKNGVRMSARYLPESIYMVVQTPDSGSMNTEPYIKMVTMNDDGTIKACEPWEPGRRSLFTDAWYTSKYQTPTNTSSPSL